MTTLTSRPTSADQSFGSLLWAASVILLTLKLGGLIQIGWLYVSLPILIHLGHLAVVLSIAVASTVLADPRRSWLAKRGRRASTQPERGA